MNWTKCYDVVAMAAGGAEKQFGTLMPENENKKTAMRFICSGIDEFAKKNNAVAYEVEVDDEMTEITISVECEPFEVDDITDVFYTIVKCAKRVRFMQVDDFYVRVIFTF